MRKLTIKRAKKYPACAVKMKVYIQDYDAPDLSIAGVPCRKLGEIKNGGEQTFDITEDATTVYVVGDILTKDHFFESRAIEAGTEHLTLTGQNYLNPGAGNPFRFDGEVSPEEEQARKKSSRKGIFVLIASVAIGLVVGFLISGGNFSAPEPKVFSADGISLTLTDDFQTQSQDGFILCCANRNNAVFVLKEEFSLTDGLSDLTLEEYAGLAALNSGFETTSHSQEGVSWFEYTWLNPDNNVTYTYRIVAVGGADAFYLVQFATWSGDADKNLQNFLTWAKSIELT